MKKFLLFSGSIYYASGGWLDFKSSHDTLEEANQTAMANISHGYDWWHVVDTETMQEVSGFGRAQS